MRILFIGDIVGRPGRKVIKQRLAAYRKAESIDLVVANGENAAGGSGITGPMADELVRAGIDGITLGDHVWDQRGWTEEIDAKERVCKPANLPRSTPGRRYLILEGPEGFRLGVCTLLGSQFMKLESSNAFEVVGPLLEELRKEGAEAVLVEFHAETTSEKVAMGWFLDGRAMAVVGTHTHIPTADCRILPEGTAYITDVGMTGPYESVLGRDIDAVLGRFQDGLPRRFHVATEDPRLCGLLMDFDREAGCCIQVTPVCLTGFEDSDSDSDGAN